MYINLFTDTAVSTVQVEKGIRMSHDHADIKLQENVYNNANYA